MMNSWMYNGRVVTADDVPEGAIGIVYKIAKIKTIELKEGYWAPGAIMDIEDKVYIGKKLLKSTNKVKIGKRAIAAERASRADGKAKTVKRVTKDSGWLSYNSSCIELQQDMMKEPERFTKEILHWCYSKKELGYMEVEEMVKHNVLRVESYNGNICGKWYRRDLIKPIEK